MNHADTRIDAAYIFTGSEVLTNTLVMVTGGKIEALVDTETADSQWEQDSQVDLSQAVLMPGLVNAHTHVPMTFLRGFADDLPLLTWLNEYVFPVEARLTADIVRLGARLGMLEMMRTGTTSFVDSYLLEANVLDEADKIGMRCLGGEVLFAFPSPAYDGIDAALNLYGEEIERYRRNSRVGVALMPHSVYTTNDDILKRSYAMAGDYGVPYHIHLSESAAEVKQCMEMHQGDRPIAYAKRMGILGPHTMLAHAVDLTDEEIDIIAESGATVVHNPVSNLKLASGFARVADLRKKGVKVALGTDGACSNNTLDMFETMKTAAILGKAVAKDAAALPAQEVLEMATTVGARCFGLSGLGTIVPGAPADVIGVDLSEPNAQPLFDMCSHLVYAASGKDCVFTMVEGNILYYSGAYYTADYEDTRDQMLDLMEWVRSKK